MLTMEWYLNLSGLIFFHSGPFFGPQLNSSIYLNLETIYHDLDPFWSDPTLLPPLLKPNKKNYKTKQIRSLTEADRAKFNLTRASMDIQNKQHPLNGNKLLRLVSVISSMRARGLWIWVVKSTIHFLVVLSWSQTVLLISQTNKEIGKFVRCKNA